MSIIWRISLQIYIWTAVMLFKVMQMYKDVVDKTTPTPSVKTSVELLRDTLPVLHSYKHMQMEEVKQDVSLVDESRTTKSDLLQSLVHVHISLSGAKILQSIQPAVNLQHQLNDKCPCQIRK